MEIDWNHHTSVTEPVPGSVESLSPLCPICNRRLMLVPAGNWWVWSCPIHGAGSFTVTNTTTPESAQITYIRNKSDMLRTGQFSMLEEMDHGD